MSCSCHCECAVPSDSIATTDDSQAACIRIIKYDASCFQASEVRHYSLSFKALLLLLILTFVTLRILCHQSDSGHAPETSVLTAVLPPTAYSRTARGHSRAATSPSSVDLASLMILTTFFRKVIDIKENLSLVTQLIHSWSASGIVGVW